MSFEFKSDDSEHPSERKDRLKIELVKYAHSLYGPHRAKIAEYCGVEYKTIYNWAKRFDELSFLRNLKVGIKTTKTQFDKSHLWKTNDP